TLPFLSQYTPPDYTVPLASGRGSRKPIPYLFPHPINGWLIRYLSTDPKPMSPHQIATPRNPARALSPPRPAAPGLPKAHNPTRPPTYLNPLASHIQT